MSLTWLATNVIATILLPPLNGLSMIALGVLLWRRRPWLGRVTCLVGFLALWILAMPVVGDALLRTLEGDPLRAEDLREAQAIVVLGGGRYLNAVEYDGDTVNQRTLARLRYAAKLQRETGLPVLVTGGAPEGWGEPEGELMRRILHDEFGVPVRWVESASADTRQNALLSAPLLKADGITRVALVTHAWHIPRAIVSFERAGLSVIPAPTGFHRSPVRPLDFLPFRYTESRYALHEWIGLLWHRLRG
jgi:uncharacterized SAM-binding protein YcdF (DUF218 family)